MASLPFVDDRGYYARARIGRGSFLLIQDAAGTQWVNVGQIRRVGNLGASRTMHDVSPADSEWTTYRPGRATGLPLQLVLIHDPDLESHREIISVFDTKAQRLMRFFTRRGGRPQSSYWEFNAFVSKYMIDTPLDDVATMTVDLAITGPTASTNLGTQRRTTNDTLRSAQGGLLTGIQQYPDYPVR